MSGAKTLLAFATFASSGKVGKFWANPFWLYKSSFFFGWPKLFWAFEKDESVCIIRIGPLMFHNIRIIL